ncbi:MAG: hypothetical protein ACKVP7_00670 [Hyphomicrobiaceae bacterium]
MFANAEPNGAKSFDPAVLSEARAEVGQGHGDEAYNRLCMLLGVALTTTLDLKSRVMAARWQARSGSNRGLVVIYDDMNDDFDFLADDIGQRITMLRGWQVARGLEMGAVAPLSAYEPGFVGVEAQVDALMARVADTMTTAERLLQAAFTARDTGSIAVSQQLRRRLVAKHVALTAWTNEHRESSSMPPPSRCRLSPDQ